MNIEQENKILKLRKQGFNYNQIRKITKYSKHLISLCCRKAGLQSPNDTRAPTEAERKMFNELYDSDKTVSEISNITGFCRSTIRKYILKKRSIVKTSTNSEAVIKWRKKIKIELLRYKGEKCENCGYSKCTEALQFHHIDPFQKNFTIAGKSWSFERLKKEVDKCVVLCANCHIETHHLK